MLSLRFGGAALLLLFAVGVVQRQRVFFGRRLMLILFLLGAVGYAGQSTLYFSALARNPAAITSILLFIYPVFVGILEWFFDRQIPTSRQWLAMGISSIGVLLILGTAGTGLHSIDLLGAVFVLGSAIWYAGVNLYQQQVSASCWAVGDYRLDIIWRHGQLYHYGCADEDPGLPFIGSGSHDRARHDLCEHHPGVGRFSGRGRAGRCYHGFTAEYT